MMKVSRLKKKTDKSLKIRRQKQISASEIAEWNKKIAARRKEKLRELRSLLRDKKIGHLLLDLETRPVARKFAKLPFGFINDSCAGHFYKKGKQDPFHRVSLEDVKQNQTLQFEAAVFELSVDYSPAGLHFSSALKAFVRKNPFVTIVASPYFPSFFVRPKGIPKETTVSMKEALKMRERNLLFLKEFERFLEPFVKKYGVPVRL